jgi:hypothetical protein
MPTARANPAIGVINGILYAVGGVNGGSLTKVEAYDPTTNTWSARADMPTARNSLGVGVINGTLYAVGGSRDTGERLAKTEAYDPSTNTWYPRANMLNARIGLGVGVINGILYAAGGADGGGGDSKLEAYTAGVLPAPVTLTLTKSGGTGVVTSMPAGIECGATCSTSSTAGTSITLSASADAGFALSGFTGGCINAATTCVFTILSDMNVIVTFKDSQAPMAPADLTAVAASSSQIILSWTAPADNVGVHHYEVERQFNNVAYALTASPTINSATNNVVEGIAYLYRVRAVDAAGNASVYSNVARATAVALDDDPIVSSSENPLAPSVVNAAHFVKLREAVNAIRVTAGLPWFNWSATDGQGNQILPPASGNYILGQHIIDLRNNLNQGLIALGFAVPSYTDPALTPRSIVVQKVHIQELRQAVK